MANRFFVVVGILALAGVSVLGQSKASIQGVWRVAERTTTGPGGTTNKSPQPSLLIFTAKHYSLMQDNSLKPRPLNDGLPAGPTAKVTEAQMVTRYQEWAPVTANAGAYELTGTTLTLRPTIAKNAAVSASKHGQTYQVKMDGDSVWLTTLTGVSGEKVANPTTVRLVRVE